MKKLLTLLFIGMALGYVNNLHAQLNDTINRHIIIAFDKKVIGIYKSFVRNHGELTRECIEQIVKTSVPYGELREGDYLSIVNYAIGNQNTIQEFVRPCQYEKEEIVWKDYVLLKNIFKAEWDPLKDAVADRIKDDADAGFSMQFAAKSHVIKALYKKNGHNYANRTYLLMVTDDKYQGSDDINKEYEASKSGKGGKFRATKEDFLSVNRDLSRNYIIEYLAEKALSPDGGYKIILFEIRPGSSFSLNSVVDYPASLGIGRVRGGYTYRFEPKPRTHDYEVLKLRMSYRDKDGQGIEIPLEVDTINEGFIPAPAVNADTLTMTIKGWLHKKDTVYGATVLNPYDEVPTSMSRDLSVDIPVDLKEEATVFGIPLSDAFWWFYPQDLQMAALVWEFIFIMLVILFVIGIIFVYVQKRSLYVPENKDIKLTHK